MRDGQLLQRHRAYLAGRDRLVMSFPRRGAFATGMDIADLAHISEIRAQLEPLAARRAAERASTTTRTELEKLAAQVDGLHIGRSSSRPWTGTGSVPFTVDLRRTCPSRLERPHRSVSSRTFATIPLAELRAEFAVRLATLYGTEVPAYNTLVEVSREVNEDFRRAHGADAERLGSIDRVTAERHGAIRVGSPRELAQAARVFAGFGMHPVGFYDLRDASKSSVPVVSTAFRPVDREELAKNPFRVFTSMLVADDRRFFDADTAARLERFVGARTLFSDELLVLADRSAAEQGLAVPDAERCLELATAAFALSSEPVDHDWYVQLEKISAVAADIGGVPSTHINHLTPRVLDIDDLYRRMQARGITMIDEIQGPPDWDGPDVLLRQTSFKALAEQRQFRHADGSVRPGVLRVRFGEVEQRGVALTTKGRELYDRMVAEVDTRLATAPTGTTRVEVARTVWQADLPNTERELALQGLAFFTYRVLRSDRPAAESATVRSLVEAGVLEPEPLVYEDFLPRSAAGIFQSNLTDEGTRDDELGGTPYDIDRLSEVVGLPIADPTRLYEAEQGASLSEAARSLDLRQITTD